MARSGVSARALNGSSNASTSTGKRLLTRIRRRQRMEGCDHLLPSPSLGPPLLSASLSFWKGTGGGFVGGAGAAVGGGDGGLAAWAGAPVMRGGGGVVPGVLGAGGVVVLGVVVVLGGAVVVEGAVVVGGDTVRDGAACRAVLTTGVDPGDVVATMTVAMIASTAVHRIVNTRRVRLTVVPLGAFVRLCARVESDDGTRGHRQGRGGWHRPIR
jgi:hypothetical protein